MSSVPVQVAEIDLLGSATRMKEALETRQISAVELIQLQLARVDEFNGLVNAVVTVDPDQAVKQARSSDDRRASDKILGPLDGIPLTAKDSLCTAGLKTVVGAPALRDYVPAEDAGAIARARQAGCVIFGKTNTPEMLNDMQTYNPVFGLTRNPWNPERSPGGSSGGSAAALAMGLTPLEIGTDIAGSLRIPAHACGVYAHKPTQDVIPQRGQIPPPPGIVGLSDLVTVGPMARTAEDLAMLFEALATPMPTEGFDWLPNLAQPRHETLREYRVAIWTEAPGLSADEETRALLETVAAALERHQVRVDRRARPFDNVGEVIDAYLTLVLPTVSGGVSNDVAAKFPGLGKRASRSAARYLDLVAAAKTQKTADYAHAKEIQARAKLQWRRFFGEFDALICPVMPTQIYEHMTEGLSWSRTLKVDDREEAYWDQVLWCGALATLAHLPSTVRPIALSRQCLPLGVQIIGPFMEDRSTIHLARLLDPLFGAFQVPSLARSAHLYDRASLI